MNMEDYVRSSREADLAFLEAANTIAIAMDTESIDLFTEGADDKKSGFVDTIISKIRDLAEKIKKFFDDLFTSAKTKLLKSKADTALKDKALANKKVEVLDTKKIGAFSKKYKEKIKNAKSIEEIDQIVAEYNKKKKIAFGVGATVGVGLGVVAGKVLAPKYKEENAKYIDQLKYEMDGAEEAYKREFDRYAKNYGSKLAEQQKSVQELRAVADSKTRIYHDNTLGGLSGSELAKKRFHVLGMVITDEMKAAKASMASKYNAIKTGITNAKETHEGKKAGEEIGKFVSNGNMVKNKDGSVNVAATQAMYSESAEADLLGFGSYDDIFEESASGIKTKISDFIDTLIKKLRELVDSVKNKIDIAKTKAILNSKLAKSNVKIMFAFHDKEIVKACSLAEKNLNDYIVAMQKLSQDLTSGKIKTTDEYYAKERALSDRFEINLRRIQDSYSMKKSQTRLNADEHEASKVREYIIKLQDYQVKVIGNINTRTEKQLKAIRDEVKRAEEAAEKAKEDARIAEELAQKNAKKALATKIARETSKVIGVIAGIAGVSVAIYAFGSKISSGKAVTESAEDFTDSLTLEEYLEFADC